MAPAKLGAGIMFVCDGEVLLLLRANTSHNCNTWGLPGGNVEPGDVDLAATARRESMEELGSLPPLYEVVQAIDTRRGKKLNKLYTVFVARVPRLVRDTWRPRLNKEHSAFRWFPLAEAAASRALHPVVERLFADPRLQLGLLAAPVDVGAANGGAQGVGGIATR